MLKISRTELYALILGNTLGICLFIYCNPGKQASTEPAAEHTQLTTLAGKIDSLAAARASHDSTIIKIEKHFYHEKINIDNLPADSLLPTLRARLLHFNGDGKPQNVKNYAKP